MILPEHEAKKVLSEAGIPVVPVATITSLQEAYSHAEAMQYPVALKISSSLYTHKSDVGAVLLNLQNREELEEGFARLEKLQAELDPKAAILLEPMVSPGVEFFIGVERRHDFGLVISFGLGGIWLELVQDVAFRLLPASRGDLKEMVNELKSMKKLREGFRYFPPVPEDQLLDLMSDISEFAIHHPELTEMDLNPVVIHLERAVVVDARIVLADQDG